VRACTARFAIRFFGAGVSCASASGTTVTRAWTGGCGTGGAGGGTNGSAAGVPIAFTAACARSASRMARAGLPSTSGGSRPSSGAS
jgi:hypothetical protein